MTTTRLRLAVPVLSIFLSLMGQRANFAANPNPEALRRGGAVEMARERLLQLQNVEARYDLETDYTPDAAVMAIWRRVEKRVMKQYPAVRAGPPFLGNFTYRCNFMFLAGRMRYGKQPTGHLRSGGLKEVQALTLGRTETLVCTRGGAPTDGEISAHAPPLDSLAISSVLGLRQPSRRSWLWIRPSLVAKMAYAKLSSRRFSLTQNGASGDEYCWIFRRTAQGLELTSLAASNRNQPGGRYVYLRGKFSNFRKVGGLLLPGRAEETFFGGPNIPDPVRSDILTHIKYTIGSPSNIPKNYLIVWPKGATVIDERIDHVFHIKSPTTLSDRDIFLRLKKRDSGSHK